MALPSFVSPAAALAFAVMAAGCAVNPGDGSSSPSGAGGAPMGVPAAGPIIGTALATFDSDADGFTLNSFPEATNLFNAPTPATLTWISTDGSPDPGCLKVTAPYSGANQWADAEAPAFSAPLPDWSGKTLHVRIKLDPSSTFSGSARLYVKTGTSYAFDTGPFAQYPQGDGWQEFVFPLVSPALIPPATQGADPSEVATFGFDPITASVPSPTPTPVTFYVDSFSIE